MPGGLGMAVKCARRDITQIDNCVNGGGTPPWIGVLPLN